ncbi:helix-turn-helix domain-containing protein (plasmid) [Pararoseomonas sp. SCSIO 73927]|uniref:MerR family transcriptional regulator n=1 Tax=Pararoseomonas sp. SCSIO 73927 TaxID=3114537 RepID=UPI0030CD710C
MGQDGIAIGELSRRTGCNIETIRYYERIGLLPTPARRGRYRLYGAGDVWRLAFVRRARELGFTLDQVRALLGLDADACAKARDLAAAHLDDVRARIADLQAMERVLTETVRRCDAGAEATCPLIEVLGGLPAHPGQAAP